MPNISVSVVDGNNITLVTTPTPTQVVTIDRGIAGPPGPAGDPAGINTQVQYNDNGAFGASFAFTYDDITRITSSNISDGVAMRDGPGFSYGSLLVEAQEPGPTSCFMRPDGLAFYVVGTTNDRIQYYSLSTAWDLSTATYVSQSISLTAQTNATHGMFFTSDGLSIFTYGSTAPASFFKYTLSVPWDISKLAYSGSSLNVSVYATGEGSLALSLDGFYLYLLSNTGTPNDVIHWWELSTPFNLATASYLSYITISPQETIGRGLAFSNDGLRMWVTGSSGNDFNIYTLATAWDLNTAVFDFVYPFPIFPTSSRGMYISPNGRFGYIISDLVGAATVYGFSQPVTEWNATGNLNANGNLAVYQNFSVAGQTSLWKASLSGNLGIGATAHPTIRLYSEKTEDGVIAYFRRTGATINPGIQISLAETTNTVLFATEYGGAVSPAIAFQTLAGQERMRIQSDGTVGINSTAPNPSNKLDVVANTNDQRIAIRTLGTTNSVSVEAQVNNYWTGSTFRGTAIQQYDSAATGTTVGMANANLGILRFQNGSAGLIYTNGSNPIVFGTTAIERVRIDSVGNVLVGISTTPATGTNVTKNLVVSSDISTGSLLLGVNGSYLGRNSSDGSTVLNTGQANIIFSRGVYNTATESMRIDNAGNVIMSTGVFLPYVPAPTATISAVTTLTNAQILPQIVVTSGTTFTLTMPLGTTLETLIAWPKINIGFDFTVINTASGTITMAVSTGVTAVGTLTVLTGISANFRLRRTAANTFIMYRV